MNKYHAVALLVALLCGLALVGIVTFALPSASLADSSANYGLSWYVLADGGGKSQSAHYILSGTNGQGAPGAAVSSHYKLGSGFWYGFIAKPAYKLFLPLIMKKSPAW
jgi:hypothetical protein